MAGVRPGPQAEGMTQARSAHFNQALLAIPRRAESVDRHTLARTFVVAGSLSAMLHSADHQVLYGRRGTGKTHALLYLADLVEHSGGRGRLSGPAHHRFGPA